MEKLQLLRDAHIEPTGEIIAEGLGAAYGTYTKFTEGLKSRDIEIDWRYYNDGKAWLGKALYKWTTSRGTQKETTAFWLSIWDGFFRIGIMLPEKVRIDAMTLPLSDEVREVIENSKQMGKLKILPLSFDLRSDYLFDEMYTLIDFRKKLK